MRLLALLAVAIPASALAAPDPLDPSDPYKPAPEPVPPADRSAPAPEPSPPAPRPHPIEQPPSPEPPASVAPTLASFRTGTTFEAGIGIGWIHYSASGISNTSDVGVAGPNLGVGHWISPRLAITGRIAGVTRSDSGIRVTNAVVVGAAQYWADDHFWLAGGLGLGLLVLTGSSFDSSQDNVTTGFGIDARVGYTFSQTHEHAFTVALELTPTLLSNRGESARYTGIGFTFGYQHL